jgi:NADH:ubiquinone oxidoreductase subunit E
MSAKSLAAQYSAVLVPALQAIQHEFGYLKREALEQFSEKSGIPLYRLQAVASFFPHFQLTPPKKCTIKVCRDMACGMAGSAQMLQDLAASLPEGQVSVEGVSCLGRCDRPPAACVAIVGEEHEHYYLARSTEDLTQIVKGYLAGTPPTPDRDADLAYPLPDWQIDSYNGEPPRYEAIQKAVRLRDEALARSTDALRAKFGWGPDRLEQFRHGAVAQLRTELELAPEVETAVRAWQTEDEWAKGNELGGW